MKKRLLTIPTSLAAVLLALAALPGPADRLNPRDEAPVERPEGCTVIMVGKNASEDGSVMTTHAADCGVCDVTWRHVPARDHKPGAMRQVLHINQIRTWPPETGGKWDMVLKDTTGVAIPQPRHTYGYHHAVFGYLNDQQLAIAESTIGNRKKMSNPTPSGIMDITMLTLLAMEQCRTAREAIRFMGGLAERYGYGFHDGGEMLAVADADEVWDFEIMPVGPLWTPASGKPGAIWCAQRVPDDEVSVCPNEARIGEINLDDPDHFMASANVVSYAVENGYYDAASGKPFSWKRAYDPVEGGAASSEGRIQRLWRFLDLVAPSRKFSPDTPNMDLPFSVKPDKKLSVRDVMALTRDKSRGGLFDPLKGIRGGPFLNPNYHRAARQISVPNVEYTTLTQCRGGFPPEIGGIVWIALGAQDTSCYVPFYAGVTEIPGSYSIGDHWVFNRDAARWAFDTVDYHAQVAYAPAIEVIKAAQEKWEGAAVAATADVDRTAAELFRKGRAGAVTYLTGYCLNNARSVLEAWWKLGDELLVRFNHFGDYDTVKRSRGRLSPADSSLWPKAVKAIDILENQQ